MHVMAGAPSPIVTEIEEVTTDVVLQIYTGGVSPGSAVTLMLIVHVEAAIKVMLSTAIVSGGAGKVMLPPHPFTSPVGAAMCSPVGNASVNAIPEIFRGAGFGFVNVKVRVTVPPGSTVLDENVFFSTGGC